MGAGQLKFLYFGAYSFRYIFVFLFFLVSRKRTETKKNWIQTKSVLTKNCNYQHPLLSFTDNGTFLSCKPCVYIIKFTTKWNCYDFSKSLTWLIFNTHWRHMAATAFGVAAVSQGGGRVKDGMSLPNGTWHGLRNDIIMRNVKYENVAKE